jgi:hypothetical protein
MSRPAILQEAFQYRVELIYKTFQRITKARQDPVDGDLLVAGRTLRMLTLPTR